MVKALIWDLDGLLIDSEPLWRQAQREILKTVGLDLSQEMMQSTMGRRIDEVVRYWYEMYPDLTGHAAQTEKAIVDRLIELVNERGEPKVGVLEALKSCRARGYKMALASSSRYRVIDAALEKLQISDFFEVKTSGEDEDSGKPDPAIFLTAAQKLSVSPDNCAVFEDSPSGVVAAKAAGMKCIAVPDFSHLHDERISQADLILRDLSQLNIKTIDNL